LRHDSSRALTKFAVPLKALGPGPADGHQMLSYDFGLAW
jgi:hypothetical protein